MSAQEIRRKRVYKLAAVALGLPIFVIGAIIAVMTGHSMKVLSLAFVPFFLWHVYMSYVTGSKYMETGAKETFIDALVSLCGCAVGALGFFVFWFIW